MKIDSITIKNYGSFCGEHRFRLADRGLCIVLGDNQDEPKMDSNGSGKSTIFDALDWALFGQVPRADHVDSVVNEMAGQDCQVDVEILDDDGRHVLVRRYRNVGGNNGSMLVVDGKELTSLDVKETQKDIERVIGMDRGVFHAAVLMAQTDLLRFADAKDSERMAVLTKILDLGQIDEWLVRAKELRKEVGARQLQLEKELNQRQGQVTMAEQQMPPLRAQAASYADARADKLRETMTTLHRHQENVPKYEANIALEPRILENLRVAEENLENARMVCVPATIAGEPPPFDPTPFQTGIAEARRVEQEWLTKREQIASDGKRVAQQVSRFESMKEGTCPECSQPITGDHLAREIARLQSEREVLRESWKTVDAEFQKVQQARIAEEGKLDMAREAHTETQRQWQRQKQAHLEAQRALEAEVHAAEQQVQQARHEVERLEGEKRSLRQTLEYIDSLKKTAEETRTKPNPYEGQLLELKDLVAGVKEQMLAYENELMRERETCAYYNFWVDALGPKGLKSYILDNRLQEMSDAANHWVRVLTGGTIWVRFETQTKGRSTDKLSNKFNIRVFRYNPDGTISERNYRSWSGGEKQRVSLAIDFGLSRLIAQRARKMYDVLILDELFRHLDRGGREAVIEMLHHLRQEKTSVIVVDHDAEFQGAFENRVLVRKQNRCSNILELDYVSAQPQGASSSNHLGVASAIP